MWPLPPIRDEYIAVSINPTYIACAWLKTSKKHPLILNAYSHFPIDLPSSIIVEQTIKQFVSQYNIHYSSLGIAVAAPDIHEQLIRLSHATPSIKDFANSTLAKMLWDYRYLHSLDDNQHLFYVCGIARSTMFTYELISHKSELHLTSLTSSYMALLYAYRTLFGPAFRQSQMALDMIRTDYKIEDALSTDSIARLLHIPAHISIDVAIEKVPLLTIIGLYNQERNNQ